MSLSYYDTYCPLLYTLLCNIYRNFSVHYLAHSEADHVWTSPWYSLNMHFSCRFFTLNFDEMISMSVFDWVADTSVCLSSNKWEYIYDILISTVQFNALLNLTSLVSCLYLAPTHQFTVHHSSAPDREALLIKYPTRIDKHILFILKYGNVIFTCISMKFD